MWGTFLLSAVIAINTRAVKVHGFTPSEILLGFNAQLSWDGGDFTKTRILNKGPGGSC